MMEADKIDKTLLTRTLNFHGVQLQKIFEAEYSNFSSLKLDSSLHFNEYAARQKQLSLKDRGKRFRLQQFICQHANQIFDKHVKPIREDPCKSRTLDSGYFPILPPYESFLTVEKEHRLQRFFEYVKQGDIIAASVLSKTAAGMILKVLYGECDQIRCVPDIGIKAFCPTSSLIAAVDKKTNFTRAFLINDLVCCEILEFSPDTGKITCGMKGVFCRPENQPRLGLMHSEDFPIEYRIYQEKKDEIPYSVLLEKSESFQNPNLTNNLMMHLGIPNELYTHFDYLKQKFPSNECAVELRIAQAAKWAIQSVTDGIEHFKCGRFSEAYQCLNKALAIDPRSVEALVARGALYANSSNYEKAIIDFENALKFNPNHQNAKKYLGDTLVAFGRTLEEINKFTEAINAYETCLAIIPNHEEASNSLQFIKNKIQAAAKKEIEEEIASTSKVVNSSSQLLTQIEEKLEIVPEIKKTKNKKRSSFSSSSSSSSGSSSDSSDSSSSSSSSHRSKQKRKTRKSKKEPSLSPLSKRMSQMENIGGPKAGGPTPLQMAGVDNENEYEFRVRRFLDETKKDEDYEEKVRKFLDETAKWKKKQKVKDEKGKRKKKEKKSKSKKKKKESKKKKKSKDSEKKRRSRSEVLDGGDLLLPENLKDLEELQSKLSAYYSKVQQDNEKSTKIEKQVVEKISPSPKRKNSIEKDNKPEMVEKNQRPVETKKPETYSNEDHLIEQQKIESNASKFKMHMNTVANKVQRRSSEDPLWRDEEVVPEPIPAEDPHKSKLPPKPRPDRREYHRNERPFGMNERPFGMEAPMSHKRSRSPPMLDKLGFLVKKMPSISPKRDYVRHRSFSRSRSRPMESPRQGPRYHHSPPPRSLSRRRYSRSPSGSGSYQRPKYVRYSRSPSYSRSRSRSPYHRSRSYHQRARAGGTYYKPRVQNFRGGYRGTNWRNNRSRPFNPRFRGGRRPFRSNFRGHHDNRDFRRYDKDRTPSDEEYWDIGLEDDRFRRHSGSEGDARDFSYDEFDDEHDDLMDRSDVKV